MQSTDHGRAYRTLDGLRGVAAFIVVTRHAGGLFPHNPFKYSFLAVDLFFLLSGFVIASAYEERLLGGMRIGQFLRIRLIRLYPLYMLGLVLGASAYAVSTLQMHQFLAYYLVRASVIGLFLLPAVPPLPMGSSALNGPTWTILPEILVNALYAVLIRRLSDRVVWMVILIGAIGLAACEWTYGTLDGGWSVDRYPLIASRLGFSFFLGIALHRTKVKRRTGPAWAWATLAFLSLALMAHPPAALQRLYELFAVLVIFPILVAIAVRREPGRLGAGIFSWLGLSSYAVYVIHAPLAIFAGMAMEALGAHRSALTALVFMVLAALIATAADAVYDRPVRRWLGRLGCPTRDANAGDMAKRSRVLNSVHPGSGASIG